MKLVTIKLNVLSELTDQFEATDVVVNQIQTVTDPKVAGNHILSTIRLKGSKRELLVWESSEEIHLAIDFAEVPWDKRPSEFWDRMQETINNPNINRNHSERLASYEPLPSTRTTQSGDC